jgi:hypothetical protein
MGSIRVYSAVLLCLNIYLHSKSFSFFWCTLFTVLAISPVSFFFSFHFSVRTGCYGGHKVLWSVVAPVQVGGEACGSSHLHWCNQQHVYCILIDSQANAELSDTKEHGQSEVFAQWARLQDLDGINDEWVGSRLCDVYVYYGLKLCSLSQMHWSLIPLSQCSHIRAWVIAVMMTIKT